MNKKKKVVAKKKYGQNFLKDKSVLQNIIDGADVNGDDIVIEIGPGRGALTNYLAKSAKEVYCFEIDESLRVDLDEVQKNYENVHIQYIDFLKLDFKAFLEQNNIVNYKVVANLPYYITTPILMKLYDDGGDFESITVMVQKEVADRLLASENTKSYGALTVLTNLICDVSIVCEVKNTCFYPVPKVDSAVIKLVRNENMKLVEDMKTFKNVVKGAFFTRRKKMINSIVGSGLVPLNKQTLLNIFEKLNIDNMARGETITLSQFINMSNEIYNYRNN